MNRRMTHRDALRRSICLPAVLAWAASLVWAEVPSMRMVPAFTRLRFDRPVCLAAAPGEPARLCVVEQGGSIRILPSSPDGASARLFLDIRQKVRRANNEEGLLALAFHPRFAANGAFFVYYSASKPTRNVLSRFLAARDAQGRFDPERAEPDTETALLEVPKRYGNHNGATLIFGADGYLYLSLGDGGGAGDPQGNAQNLSDLHGKILRIDVDHEANGLPYSIPKDNPFVGRPGARGEVWAYGLRNVWRMSFDRETGDLWAGDVGQDKWEEVDRIVKGGNYGWNLFEGRHAFHPAASGPPDPPIGPVLEYGHDEGASITGGYVYRGERMPRLKGVYLYADFVTGRVWGMRYSEGRVIEQREVLRQDENIASFGEGIDGELYALCFDGRIYRFEEP